MTGSLTTGSGAWLAGLGHAHGPHVLDGERAVTALCELFPEEDPGFVRRLVSGSGIEHRPLALRPHEVFELGDFTARNARYAECAVELAEAACRRALENASWRAADVDVVIDVSCTGFTLPALDVALSERLDLWPAVLRVPVAEAGCAGGALGLSLAASLARDGRQVLVCATEICSLTFCDSDRSRANLVAAALFADGAGAACVGPEPGGVRLRANRSHLVRGTEESLGFEVGAHGLRILLARDLPVKIERELRPVVERFLEGEGLELAELSAHLPHPGGKRILDAYASALELPPDSLAVSRTALAQHGNLSSAAIFSVLERAFGARPAAPGSPVLALGIGPGLSFELLLIDSG